MPCYCFICSMCGKSFEKNMPMSQTGKEIKCECGGLASRDFQAEICGGVLDSQHREYNFEGDHGTRCYAGAYLPQQKEEMRKNHPGRDFKFRNNCYIPVIKDRQDYKKFLKERGNWVEY